MDCPICKTNPTYRKEKIVKDGYFNGTIFITTGTRNTLIEYWTCKKCTKIVPVKIYTEKMIEYFNNLEEEEDEEYYEDEISRDYFQMFK